MRRQMMGAAPSEPRYYLGVDLGAIARPDSDRGGAPRRPPVPDNDFGLKPKVTYARGSAEWPKEQQRLENKQRQNETVLKLLQNRGAATEPFLL